MKVRTMVRPLLAALLVVGLGGCYGDGEITLHEPGVYKGTEDPLVNRLSDNEELHNELQARLETATDGVTQ
jgi:hypothetical protein